MSEISEIEKAEKIQEKIVKKKKAYTERAKEKGDSKNIEKAKEEEAEAIAVLEKIQEDKRRAEEGSIERKNISQAQSEKILMKDEKILKTLKPSRWSYLWWYPIGGIVGWLIFFLGSSSAMYFLFVEDLSTTLVLLTTLLFSPILGILIGLYIVELVRKGNTYYITDRRTIHEFTFLKRDFSSAAYDKIQDLHITQGIIERIVGIGTIHINTAGSTFIEVRFKGISDPISVKRVIEEIMMPQG